MDKNIVQVLNLSDDVADILTGTLYDISIDDGKNNSIKIPDKWTLRRFVEAGIIRDIKEAHCSVLWKVTEPRQTFGKTLRIELNELSGKYWQEDQGGRFNP
ncbi:MAG: hypothetical protein K2O97_15060 [Acetatifactor sp.]|jgi:hypothetical protein|nr:hypothetical protein [Acetatifactor sp.]